MEGVDPSAARIAAQCMVNDASAVASCGAEANAAAAGVGYGHVMAAANGSIESLTSMLETFTKLLETKATAIELAASGVDYGLVGSVQSLGRAATLTLNSQLDDAYVNPLIAETGLLAPETKAAVEKVLDASKNDPAAMAAVFSELSVETQIEVSQSRPDLVAALIPELGSIHPVLLSDLRSEFRQKIGTESVAIDGSLELKGGSWYGKVDGKYFVELNQNSDGSSVLKLGGALDGGLGRTLSGLGGPDAGVGGAGKVFKEIKFPAGFDSSDLIEEFEASFESDLPINNTEFDIREVIQHGPMNHTRDFIARIEEAAIQSGGSSSIEWTAEAGVELDWEFSANKGPLHDADKFKPVGTLGIDGDVKFFGGSDGSQGLKIHVGADVDGVAGLNLDRLDPSMGIGWEPDVEITFAQDGSGQNYVDVKTVSEVPATFGADILGIDTTVKTGDIVTVIYHREVDDFYDPRDFFFGPAKVTKVVSTSIAAETTIGGEVGMLGQGGKAEVGIKSTDVTISSVKITPVGGETYDPIAAVTALDPIEIAPVGGLCEVPPSP